MATIAEPVVIRRSWHREVENFGFTVVLGVVAFLVLYPLLLLVVNSFQTAKPGEMFVLSLDNWRLALAEPGMRSAIWNTISLTFARQIIAFPLAIFVAWLLARTDIPARHFLEFLFWVSFFLPSLAVTQGWILLLDPQYGLINQIVRWLGFQMSFDIYSWGGIVWVHLMANAICIKVMLLTPAFRNMNASMEEASQICGASKLGTLLRVVVPIMTPTILVVLLMSFIRSLEAFEIEMILGAPQRIEVYSTKIYRLILQEPPLFGPATVLGVLILLLMLPLILMQRWMTGRRLYTTVTGQYKGQVIRLRSWRWVAFALVLFVVSLLTVIPIVLLFIGTFMRLYGFFNLPNPWTLNHWHTVFSDPIFLRSLGNTLTVSTGAGLLSVLCYSVVAYIIVRTRFWGKAALDFLSWLLFALPGMILALGFLWVFLGVPLFRPLYGSILLLILVTTLNSMTLGVQIIKGSMVQLGSELEEAAWIVGGSKWQTFRHVLVPILAPVILLVGAVSFISAARNISHLALLSTSAIRPLSVLQLEYMVEGRYEAASLVGVIVTTLTIGVAFGVRRLSARFGIKA